jgi:hypothetical protein
MALIWRRRHRPLPNFKLNLFIQAKRCFFHKAKPRHLKASALNSPCWRFDITPHQQEALEKVAAKISRRAVVCYAAPAFHRFSELYAHTAARTINQNSTFPTVEKLTGHSAWYYDRPGGSGVANADPENIEGPDIFGLLRNLEEYRAEDDYSLTGLSSSIEAGLQEAPQDNPRRAAYFDRRDYLRSQLYRTGAAPREPSVITAFFDVAVFAEVFNLDWYVVG